MKVHRGVSHMPINDKKPQDYESVKNTTREKIVENIESTIPVIQKTPQEIVENNDQTPEYAVDFVSKTFGPIKLKEIRDSSYTLRDIKLFFMHLDFMDKVTILVDDPKHPYIDNTSVFRISLSPERYDISTQLFWKCIPAEVKQKFKKYQNYLVVFEKLFAYYHKKISFQKK